MSFTPSPGTGASREHLSRPVADFLRPGPPPLRVDQTIGEALGAIRSTGLEERIFYFYVVDAGGRLSGVVPARKLLTEPLVCKVGEVMVNRVLSLPEDSTLLEACECFILHKFLAIPVVDSRKRLRGIIDVGIFTDEVMELGTGGNNDQLFQSIGIHVQEIQHASPFKAFGIRFPWLAATVSGGLLCAVMAGSFAATLQQKVVLAVFMALVLGLGEAVAAQSLALTVQSFPFTRVSWRWLRVKLRREAVTSLLLGLLAGAAVAVLVGLFSRDLPSALSIGGSVVVSILMAGLLGVLIPSLLRLVHRDPKIAAGPITLAAADLFTVSCYLVTARLVLG
ncbi:MAG: magnesium transporter, partial [Chthoniobacterales bacterium]